MLRGVSLKTENWPPDVVIIGRLWSKEERQYGARRSGVHIDILVFASGGVDKGETGELEQSEPNVLEAGNNFRGTHKRGSSFFADFSLREVLKHCPANLAMRRKKDLYSWTASWPKAKKIKKKTADIRKDHQRTYVHRRTWVGISTLGNWPTREKFEWTSAQLTHGRSPSRKVKATLMLIINEVQTICVTPIAINRK